MRPAFLWMLAGLGLLLALALPRMAATPYALAQERPTIPPERPTIPSGSEEGGDTGGRGHASRLTPGRITGTVIDLTTGAPTPDIAVRVGDVTVLSDANGNYDAPGLAPGSYAIQLELAGDQGEPAQGPLVVMLDAGATIVQHLAFRSQPQATSTPETSPTPTVAPVPPELPNTGSPADPLSLAALVALAYVALIAGAMLQRSRPS